jgi:hypothetical protein
LDIAVPNYFFSSKTKMNTMTKKQLQQKRRYQKRKQLLDQLLYEQPQSLKANTFVPIDSRHKLTRFHKAETIETEI